MIIETQRINKEVELKVDVRFFTAVKLDTKKNQIYSKRDGKKKK